MLNVKTLKNDIPSGIVVFLVALPLCLGVALASGAPLLSGVISGIIGGLVVGMLSQSQTSVSGPAAGLAAVVLSAITELKVFEVFLVAVMLAGVIQLIMGLFNAGVISDYIPSNVIKGLLAAIGIILILKQIPHAIGYDKDPLDDFSFLQTDGENTFTELLKAIQFITPGALVVSVISILILAYWHKTPLKSVKFFPASLFVVILGVFLNWLFGKIAPQLLIEQSHLVNIPPVDTNNLFEYFYLPSLSALANPAVWKVAFTIAIIASLETLLNIEAVDKLDPHKRHSPPNRELVAQGAGNVLAGLFGGIPVTSVIVRSSVNIESGNETKASTILHGIFMLVSVLVLAPWLNLIPLASLAAILLLTGYKLAKISLFKDMYAKGMPQFIPFVITIVAIVFTDLLVGVLIGLAVSVFYILRSNFRNPFEKHQNSMHIGDVIKIQLQNQVSFLNKASLKDTLWSLPQNSKVVIDATGSRYIDFDVLEVISDFKNVFAPENNIQVNILGMKDNYKLNDFFQFSHTLDKETQEKLTPQNVLELLKSGNTRFTEGKGSDKNYLQQIHAVSTGQNPMAVIIGCIDSRTSPEIVFDSALGDLLTIRIAGNIISPEIVGSIELAVSKLGAKLIVVKGHSQCGAVSGALYNLNDSNIGTITSKINKAVVQCGCEGKKPSELSDLQVDAIGKQNVTNSLNEILAFSPYLKEQVALGKIGIIGAYHDLGSGKVVFGDFVEVSNADANSPSAMN